jgi:hypothetical protein
MRKELGAAHVLLGLQFLLYDIAVGDASGLQDSHFFLKSCDTAINHLHADELRLHVLAQGIDGIVPAVDRDGLLRRSSHKFIL